MNEVWKDAVGYEGVYLVSNMGNIKKVGSAVNINPTLTESGYLRVCMCVKGRQKTTSVHRLVALAFINNPESKSEVNHINGVKNDNRVENLEWCTRSENMFHAIKTGLCNFGSISGSNSKWSKLTEKDVTEIVVMLFKGGLKYSEIAKKYGVNYTVISKIHRKIIWRHVTKNIVFNQPTTDGGNQ